MSSQTPKTVRAPAIGACAEAPASPAAIPERVCPALEGLALPSKRLRDDRVSEGRMESSLESAPQGCKGHLLLPFFCSLIGCSIDAESQVMNLSERLPAPRREIRIGFQHGISARFQMGSAPGGKQPSLTHGRWAVRGGHLAPISPERQAWLERGRRLRSSLQPSSTEKRLPRASKRPPLIHQLWMQSAGHRGQIYSTPQGWTPFGIAVVLVPTVCSIAVEDFRSQSRAGCLSSNRKVRVAALLEAAGRLPILKRTPGMRGRPASLSSGYAGRRQPWFCDALYGLPLCPQIPQEFESSVLATRKISTGP